MAPCLLSNSILSRVKFAYIYYFGKRPASQWNSAVKFCCEISKRRIDNDMPRNYEDLDLCLCIVIQLYNIFCWYTQIMSSHTVVHQNDSTGGPTNINNVDKL